MRFIHQIGLETSGAGNDRLRVVAMSKEANGLSETEPAVVVVRAGAAWGVDVGLVPVLEKPAVNESEYGDPDDETHRPGQAANNLVEPIHNQASVNKTPSPTGANMHTPRPALTAKPVPAHSTEVSARGRGIRDLRKPLPRFTKRGAGTGVFPAGFPAGNGIVAADGLTGNRLFDMMEA